MRSSRRPTHPLLLPALLALALVLSLGACSPAEKEPDDEYAESMVEEHASDDAAASPMTADVPEDVTGEEVAYGSDPEGNEIEGFLARPEEPAGGTPAMIVIHEWWGLNDNVRRMTKKLAGEGYVSLAVDLYGGYVASEPEAAQKLMRDAMEREDQLEESIRQAYEYLENEVGAEKIGVIGWCFGGGWSLKTALMFPEELDAAVIYYGRLVTDPEELADLEVPILGLFGADDQGIPVESVEAFDQALQELDKTAEIHVYEGAEHAFANPSGQRYNTEAAEMAWKETLDFLSLHLRGESADTESGAVDLDDGANDGGDGGDG